MSLTSLSPTITTLNRSTLFSPQSSNGQGDTLSNYSLFKLTGHLTSSLLILMVTHSSLLPAILWKLLQHWFVHLLMGCYQVRSFPVYCYSWSPRLPSFRDQLSYLLRYGQLLRQQPEIQHTVSCVPGRWSKVHRVPRDFHSWSSWYDIIWVQRSHLPGSGKPLQSEVQHKQHFVQADVEIGTQDEKRNDQES